MPLTVTDNDDSDHSSFTKFVLISVSERNKTNTCVFIMVEAMQIPV